ncbi:Fructose-2 6-bisphosphatase [Paramagnetospirillum magnetotacticum MS-1]|uniref:Fructose-2 6-bisphosphatase n=1 Tax=Paramagnetospirillum magnetotacticum MS-1 TaxID=272627 RepID=A0A0C2UVY3_PARME|nr:histidine phosphatase family protein [Paramagnetospirillum magnetotacticum]KIL96976.1 Fructose-2 6-bisphosphatase [Paramagnetospirillum magnetotacticum MS-1]
MKITVHMAIALFVATAVLVPVAADADATGAAPAEAAKFKEITATKETLEQLRRGGWVLYMRHGRTDNTKPDRYPSVDLNDCSTQRPLTEDGLKMAAEVGEEVRKARIPVGEIRISPLCRVKDTVAAAFPNQAFTLDNELLYTANLTDVEKQPIIANTRRLLSTPVANGVNRLLIAHAPNLMDLIGYFPKEGTLVVFRPKGNGEFDYIASIPPTLWPSLQH